jgi:hypothetical protein
MSAFSIVFCRDPIEPRYPDRAFDREVEACRRLGLGYILIDHDAADRRNDGVAAIAGLRPSDNPMMAVYRGWMLTVEGYATLHGALASRTVTLINSPEHYAACHHWPEACRHLPGIAPRTVTVEADSVRNPDAVADALAVFGGRAVIVKDWVKSQAAGYWREACHIPDSSDFRAATKVVDRFLELQGDSLAGGLVFKEFHELAKTGGMADEWRSFILEGTVIGTWPRDEIEGGGPPADLVAAVASSLPSRFFSADFARKTDGSWMLIEVGDGQVSSIPDSADPDVVFHALACLP